MNLQVSSGAHPASRPVGRNPGLPASAPARRLARVDGFTLLLTALTLLGLILRIAAAQGDLGLDEAWSLELVSTLPSVGSVFWGLSHDNNHLLNSVWLYALGQGSPAWVYRLPAIALGTLTVPATARWLGRRNPSAGVFGALFAAVALPLVDFGSEARGYAGLALANVLALDAGGRAVEAALDPRPDGEGIRRATWHLGFAVGFGALCHLAMINTIAVLGLTMLIRLVRAKGRLGPALVMSARIMLPSAVLVLPAVAALVAGVVVTGRWKVGDIDPFSIAKLADGYGEMLLYTAGLPDTIPAMAGILAALLLVGVAIRRRLVAPEVSTLAVAALVVLPAAVTVARLPNVAYPRYFAICGLVLMALMAETLAALWAAGGPARRPAGIAVLAIAVGSLALDASAIDVGRGGAGATLAIMRSEGALTYAGSHPVMAGLLLDAATRGGAPPAIAIPDSAFCAAKPDWFIAVGTYDPRPDGTATVGPESCRTVYRMRAPFSASPMSGTQWTLYRRS